MYLLDNYKIVANYRKNDEVQIKMVIDPDNSRNAVYKDVPGNYSVQNPEAEVKVF